MLTPPFIRSPGLVETDMAKDAISKLDEASRKAYGVMTPPESAAAYIKNLEKIKTDKPEKAVFLFPGGTSEEW